MTARRRATIAAALAGAPGTILGLISILATSLPSEATTGISTTPDLVFEVIIEEARYCQAGAGGITLDLRFELRSQSATPIPLVLPLFAQGSGYELFRNKAAAKLRKAESSRSFKSPSVVNVAKFNSPEPDARLFRIVPVGQTASFYGKVSIPVVPKRHNTASLLGEDRYLRLRVYPWSATRKEGERLQTLWQSSGWLWTTEVVSLPIEIHIERDPKLGLCWMQID